MGNISIYRHLLFMLTGQVTLARANPFGQESGTGYHISNSLMAIGNGGLFGRGLGNSIMKLGYLPEPHTDFIFAVICEELGLVGGLIVIILEYFIVYRAFHARNKHFTFL